MLVLLWTELETVSAEIERIQSARNAAKQSADGGSVGALSVELEAALSAQEDLVARIGALVGDVGEVRATIRDGQTAASATSPYLNQKIRELSEVFKIREKGNIRPASIAADCKSRLSFGPLDAASSIGLLNMTTRTVT